VGKKGGSILEKGNSGMSIRGVPAKTMRCTRFITVYFNGKKKKIMLSEAGKDVGPILKAITWGNN